MAFFDSTFLLEIVIEELRSYTECKEFSIKTQFADVFTLNLKDPCVWDPRKSIVKMKKFMRKTKVKNAKPQKVLLKRKTQNSDSIKFTKQISTLITSMKICPIELTLYSKNPKNRLGSCNIPWSPVYIEYLYKLHAKFDPTPPHVSGGYHFYDDRTSRRMATIRLNIKLTHLKDNLTSSICLTEGNDSFMVTALSSKPSTSLTTIKKAPSNFILETGIIKTTYDRKHKIKGTKKSKTNKEKPKEIIEMTEEGSKQGVPLVQAIPETQKVKSSIMSLVKSYTDIGMRKRKEVYKTKSCLSVSRHNHLSNIIFKDNNSHFYNQIYCVSYFTVEDTNAIKSPSTHDTSASASKASSPQNLSPKRSPSRDMFKFKICNKECEPYDESVCSVPLYAKADDLITIKPSKCKQVTCDSRKHRPDLPVRDDDIRLDLTSLVKDCCSAKESPKNVVAGVKAEMKDDEKQCYCTCECTFGFIEHATFCEICGGYERAGEDLSKKHADAPFPCPIFHKLHEKKPKPAPKKEYKRKKKDKRFKFHYGFVGIPLRIGHSQCAMPCTGNLDNVPKNMGWMWNADNVPGLKFRPSWKPGAINKRVARLLKFAKNPGIITKRRKKDTGKPKRPLKRPLITVAKKDGEYTVTMETMKAYQKHRSLNQQPYEDKPVLTYTIGRTEEENRERQKKKDRQKRRLERDQRAFIQSAFTNMCKEICLKTYQQALGILPDTEDPDCTCYPKCPGAEDTNLDFSCSCSEDDGLISSDTDSDEWIVEFTPPNAKFDPTSKAKKIIMVDNESQYTYLDYRVKLLDRAGNQVPRYFKGPDGKTQCSDFGGFWSKENKWLTINSDGYIAPDGRWAPMTFHGPDGEQVDCDTGKFLTSDLRWLVVGVDGYIDEAGIWKVYPKPKSTDQKKLATGKNGAEGKQNDKRVTYKPSQANCSCSRFPKRR